MFEGFYKIRQLDEENVGTEPLLRSRIAKYIFRINYSHFSQWDKSIPEMTKNEYDNIKMNAVPVSYTHLTLPTKA